MSASRYHALWAALLCALVVASAPQVAVANEQRFPVDGPAVAAARAIAAGHWGGAPCGGDVTIRWAVLPRDHNALSRWFNPYGEWDRPDSNYDCVVELNSGVPYDWSRLCTIIVHEYGHLHGHRHEAASAGLMAELYTSPLPACAGPTTTAEKRIDATAEFRRRPASRARTRMRALRLARGRAG